MNYFPVQPQFEGAKAVLLSRVMMVLRSRAKSCQAVKATGENSRQGQNLLVASSPNSGQGPRVDLAPFLK